MSNIDKIKLPLTAVEYHQFFTLSLDLFAVADPKGFFLHLNDAWEKTLGWQQDELLAEAFLNFVHPDDIADTLEQIKRQEEGETVLNFVNRYRCKDGSYRWLEWKSTMGADGFIYAIARDKSAQMHTEMERDRFFNLSIDLLVIANTDGTFRQVNERWTERLGWSEHELLNRPFFDFIHPDDIAPTLSALEREKKGQSVYAFVNRYRCKNGGYRWLEWFAEPEPDGTIYAVARDITERKANEEKIRSLAMTDPLTGLANRMQFDQRLSQSLKLAAREQKTLAFMMVDLDRFKAVNDCYGHQAGDAVLKNAAAIFTRLTRQSDAVSRLGGDEFAILLVHPNDIKDTLEKAQKVIAEMSKPQTILGQKIQVGASIGLAFYPDDADNKEALLKKADIALYEAKAQGRNRLCRYSAK